MTASYLAHIIWAGVRRKFAKNAAVALAFDREKETSLRTANYRRQWQTIDRKCCNASYRVRDVEPIDFPQG